MASWLSTVSGLLVVVALTLSAVSSNSCTVKDGNDEKTFDDGETFTLDMSGTCIKYLCNKGSYAPSEIKCFNQNDNQCYDLGKELTNNCVTMVCKNNGTIGFQFTNRQCADSEGNCHSNGESFTKQHEGHDISCTCVIDGDAIGYTCP